ncbi:protein kinase [candidate division KSB1 bacterium]|nr:protein kinase [candidate division KSB1 bacterium]MBL7093593.1 protein kinase [candidate division KSB1 bacterium]
MILQKDGGQVGKTISHYKILEKLGEGGMGVVYKAEDSKLKRFVALKFLSPHLTLKEEAISRFIYEAQTASSLDHQNICTIHKIDKSENDQLHIAMAYYDGETLKQKINRGPLPLEEAVDITIQITNGLAKAHEKGIIHRDIKPANIIVQQDGTVKIIDFGLSKLAGVQNITQSGSTLGTVAYMSGEQVLGKEVDFRSDIWSLGVVMYEMLTGQRPFAAEYEQTVIYYIINEEPKPVTALRPDAPAALERIVNKALFKEKEKRYQEVNDLLTDLKKASNKVQISVETSAHKKVSDENKIARFSIKENQSSRLKNFFKNFYSASRQRKILLAAGIIFLVVLGFLIVKNQFFSRSIIPVSKQIAVISFENHTGDIRYDYLQVAIPNLLITSLEQSSELQVATWDRLKDLLKQTEMKDDFLINNEVGFELCRRAGISLIVTGSYTVADDLFVTDAKVLDVSTKELITGVRSKGNGLASIVDIQIDEISTEIAKGVGLSEQKIAKTQKRIVEVTTSSIEAYKHYIRGKDELVRKNWLEAIQFFKKSIEIDSTFAMESELTLFVFCILQFPNWFGGFGAGKNRFSKI